MGTSPMIRKPGTADASRGLRIPSPCERRCGWAGPHEERAPLIASASYQTRNTYWQCYLTNTGCLSSTRQLCMGCWFRDNGTFLYCRSSPPQETRSSLQEVVRGSKAIQVGLVGRDAQDAIRGGEQRWIRIGFWELWRLGTSNVPQNYQIC